jgi:uncharacterized protein YdeI (YjbR/CyaY-like superfamily)
MPKPLFFASPAAFREWLERHAERETELLVGFYKVGTGLPSLTWPESVDEALCFGWIDSIRRRLDERSYTIRFTPRREGSVWSAVNIARVEALTAQGRMRPAGLAAFARRSECRSREQDDSVALSDEELRTFKRNKAAWHYFEAAPPGYRRLVLRWLADAKQAATRARRLAQLIDACAAGERLFK